MKGSIFTITLKRKACIYRDTHFTQNAFGLFKAFLLFNDSVLMLLMFLSSKCYRLFYTEDIPNVSGTTTSFFMWESGVPILWLDKYRQQTGCCQSVRNDYMEVNWCVLLDIIFALSYYLFQSSADGYAKAPCCLESIWVRKNTAQVGSIPTFLSVRSFILLFTMFVLHNECVRVYVCVYTHICYTCE